MNKCITSWLMVLGLGLMLSASCASNAPSERDVQTRDFAKRHERAQALYQAGRINQAEQLWMDMQKDALFGNDLKRAADAAYHAGLCAWRGGDHEAAYDQFLMAEEFRKQAKVAHPENALMLAQADWLLHKNPASLTAIAGFAADPHVPVDIRLQSLLVIADARQAGLTLDGAVPARQTALWEAEKLYDALNSAGLKRHLQHVLAAEAVTKNDMRAAAGHLHEALRQARRAGQEEWTSLHTYELARLDGEVGDFNAMIERAFLSASMWQSLNKPEAASLVLQNAREAVRESGHADRQALMSSLDQRLSALAGGDPLKGDLDSIVLSALNDLNP